MYLFLSILILLAALALVFIVLVQNSKGGGLASGFAATNSIMGVRKTTDVLEKSTWWFAGVIMVLCIVSTAFISNSSERNANINQAIINQEKQNQAQQGQLPNFGASMPVTPTATQPTQAPSTHNTTPVAKEQTKK